MQRSRPHAVLDVSEPYTPHHWLCLHTSCGDQLCCLGACSSLPGEVALTVGVVCPVLQIYNLMWTPWPLPMPEVVNYCYGLDMLDLKEKCVLLQTSSTELPVSP